MQFPGMQLPLKILGVEIPSHNVIINVIMALLLLLTVEGLLLYCGSVLLSVPTGSGKSTLRLFDAISVLLV